MRKATLRAGLAGFLFLCVLLPGRSPSLAAGPVALDVPLVVEEPGAGARVWEFVRSGIPLPRSAGITDASGLSLVGRDRDGEWTREVPLQVAVTSRWGARPDDPAAPIRWVRVAFPVSIARGGREEFRLRHAAARAPAGGGLVTDAGDALVVDTGALRFRVPKARFGLFEERSVFRRGEWRSAGGRGAFDVRLRDADGQEYAASLAAPREVVVEENGPLVSVIRIRGGFATAGGKPLLEGWAGYAIRVRVCAQSSFVRLFFTLENDGLYGRESDWSVREGRPRWLLLDRLSLDLDAALRGETRVSTGAAKDAIGRDGAGAFRLFQGHDVGEAPEERVSEEGNFFYEVRVGARTVRRGLRSRGVVRVSDDDRGVTVGVRHFWQNYPKAISFVGGRLSVELWPEEGYWPENQAGLRSGAYQFEGGRHKTHEIGYSFGPPATGVSALAARLSKPLFARAPAEWYARSGAVDFLTPGEFPVGNPATARAMRRFEQMQEAIVDVRRAERQPKVTTDGRVIPPISLVTQRESRGNAFRTVGDTGAVGAMTYDIDHYGWFSFGDIPNANGWSSLTHDWPYGMLLQYLRHEGMREFLDYGEEMVRHRYDIDQYHCRDESHENWWFYNGFQRFDRGWHGDESRRPGYRSEAPPRPGHTWLAGLLLHYALTGDPRSLEAARENADAFANYYEIHDRVRERTTAIETPSDLRDAALAILGLTEFHRFTGEARYLEVARAVFENVVRFSEERAGNSGFLLPDGPQDMESLVMLLEPLRRLHETVGDPEVLALLARILNRLEAVYLAYSGTMVNGGYLPLQLPRTLSDGPRDGWWVWSGLRVADAFAYLYLKTGEAGALEFARRLFHDSVVYFQAGENHPVPAEFESEISFSPRAYPFQEALVNACVLRAHQVFLRAERVAAGHDPAEYRFPFDDYLPPDRGHGGDREPPVVTVADIRVAASVVEITIVTDEDSFVQVEYGPDPRRTALSARSPRPGRIHRIRIPARPAGASLWFRVRARDAVGNRALTAFRPLRLTPDAEPPAVTRVSAPEEDRVVVEFSEPVNLADAEDTDRFRIEGAAVTAATPDPTGRRVLLTTTPLAPGRPYRITVAGIRDRAEPPTAMPGGGDTRLFYRDVFADDAGDGFRAIAGRWERQGRAVGAFRDGTRSEPPGDAAARAEWLLPVPETGDYEVFVRWPVATNAASRAEYGVRHFGGVASVVRDQRILGGEWVRLGIFPFRAADGAAVSISTEGADGVVYADAVRLVFAGER